MRHDDDPRPLGTADRLDLHPRAKARLDRDLVAHAAPEGLECEAFRGLYYRLRRAMGGQPLGVLGVVSSTRGEGRSTVAANLALVAARETQAAVGLVDADLRAPGLHRLFDLDGEVGLSDVLANRADFEAALVEHGPTGLSILPGGRRETEPARRFMSPRFHRVLASLREKFDEVVVDLPPLAFADARLAAAQCSGVLVVVRAGRTDAALVTESIAALEGVRVLGAVLNGTSELGAPQRLESRPMLAERG